MKLISVFKLISYVLDLICHLFLALILNNSPLRTQDMNGKRDKRLNDNCVKSGDNKTNVNNDGSSDDSNNTKFTTTEDNDDKNKEDDNNNNCFSYSKSTTHPNPVITNYYCYDQRVYNIYKMNESAQKSSGFGIWDAIGILNWKYILIVLTLIVGVTVSLCYLGADMLSWLIFHKVFGYLFNNHFVVVRSDVPV